MTEKPGLLKQATSQPAPHVQSSKALPNSPILLLQYILFKHVGGQDEAIFDKYRFWRSSYGQNYYSSVSYCEDHDAWLAYPESAQELDFYEEYVQIYMLFTMPCQCDMIVTLCAHARGVLHHY